jgi:hypothetical protein
VRRAFGGDLVTVADRASERLIVERLLGAFPESAILGEEEGARAGHERRTLDRRSARRHDELHARLSILLRFDRVRARR